MKVPVFVGSEVDLVVIHLIDESMVFLLCSEEFRQGFIICSSLLFRVAKIYKVFN